MNWTCITDTQTSIKHVQWVEHQPVASIGTGGLSSCCLGAYAYFTQTNVCTYYILCFNTFIYLQKVLMLFYIIYNIKLQ